MAAGTVPKDDQDQKNMNEERTLRKGMDSIFGPIRSHGPIPPYFYFVVVIVVLCFQLFFVYFSFNGSCLFLTPDGQDNKEKESMETVGQM